MKALGTKELETKRLILRKISTKDIANAYENIFSNDNVFKYLLEDKHQSIKDTEILFSNWEYDYINLYIYRWIIELKSTHEVIGIIDIKQNKYYRYDTCDIGFCLGEKYWHQGYMYESLQEIIKFLFEEVEIETLFAETLEDNIKCINILNKLNMNYEGILRNRVIAKEGKRTSIKSFSLLKEEYFKKRGKEYE